MPPNFCVSLAILLLALDSAGSSGRGARKAKAKAKARKAKSKVRIKVPGKATASPAAPGWSVVTLGNPTACFPGWDAHCERVRCRWQTVALMMRKVGCVCQVGCFLQ